jgi:translation initiation factor IF-2
MMKGTLKPVYEEVETGEALVQQIWTHSKIGTIAGCKVVSGEVNRSDSGRVLRDGVVIYATKIASLKHYKDDVAKIKKDMECGIVLDKWGDIKPNDIIQTYKVVESKKK